MNPISISICFVKIVVFIIMALLIASMSVPKVNQGFGVACLSKMIKGLIIILTSVVVGGVVIRFS